MNSVEDKQLWGTDLLFSRDAATLYERVSVRPSVGPLVRNPFLINRENGMLLLVEIQENSAKFKKIQQFIGCIIVRIELV